MLALPAEPHLVLKSKDMPLLRLVMKASVFILLVRLLGAAPLRLCVTVRLRVIRSACSRPCSRHMTGSCQHCCTGRRPNRLPCLSNCALALGPAPGSRQPSVPLLSMVLHTPACFSGCVLEGDQTTGLQEAGDWQQLVPVHSKVLGRWSGLLLQGG